MAGNCYYYVKFVREKLSYIIFLSFTADRWYMQTYKAGTQAHDDSLEEDFYNVDSPPNTDTHRYSREFVNSGYRDVGSQRDASRKISFKDRFTPLPSRSMSVIHPQVNNDFDVTNRPLNNQNKCRKSKVKRKRLVSAFETEFKIDNTCAELDSFF